MSKRRVILIAIAIAALSLSLGMTQAPIDYLQHPAVRENLNLRTRMVLMEMAVYELQDRLVLQDQRLVALEADMALLDPAYIDTFLTQLQTQQQVLLQEVKVVETQPTGDGDE